MEPTRIIWKNGAKHTCMTEEQLQRFIAAGWKIIEQKPKIGKDKKTEKN